MSVVHCAPRSRAAARRGGDRREAQHRVARDTEPTDVVQAGRPSVRRVPGAGARLGTGWRVVVEAPSNQTRIRISTLQGPRQLVAIHRGIAIWIVCHGELLSRAIRSHRGPVCATEPLADCGKRTERIGFCGRPHGFVHAQPRNLKIRHHNFVRNIGGVRTERRSVARCRARRQQGVLLQLWLTRRADAVPASGSSSPSILFSRRFTITGAVWCGAVRKRTESAWTQARAQAGATGRNTGTQGSVVREVNNRGCRRNAVTSRSRRRSVPPSIPQIW